MIMLASFIIYFCFLTGIGLYFYHKNKNAADYMIGNRSLNYWVTAIATQASDMGSWLFLGFPAVVFANGLFEFWAAIGLIIFMFLSWQYIAPKLRVQTEQYNALTLSSYFSHKLKDTSGIVAFVSACITIFYFTAYITSGIVGLGRLFASAFEISYELGIVLGLLCGMTYTLIGGFLAVAWCDMFQGIFLMVMIMAVPIVAYIQSGGYTPFMLALEAKQVSLSLLSSQTSLLTALCLAAGWGLGYFGQPHILMNFMGIDDPKKIASAKWVGLTWQIIVLSAAAAIGLVGISFFHQGFETPELLFVIMAKTLFPPLLAGFVLCAILAATLSTMDSHILISGSTFAEDVYLKYMRKNASSIECMWVSRAASIVLSCLALYIAASNTSSIYDLVNYAWSGMGSAFGPLVIALLYLKGITKEGAIAGMLTGALVSGLWPLCNSCILPMVPGFGIGFIALLAVSRLTRK